MDDNDDDPILETEISREVSGVLHSRGALEATFEGLLNAGFDRSEIDIMGEAAAVRQHLGADPEEASGSDTHRSLVTAEDRETTTIGAFQTLFTVGAMATALTVVASGGAFALALVAATAAGTVTGSLGAVAARVLGDRNGEEIERAIRHGGVVLWIRGRNPEREALAQKILVAHGADSVMVHEIEVDKRVMDLPLGDLQPDPFLERDPVP